MELLALHLFAGAGGGILADLLLGHRTIGAVEIEKYPRKVLLARQLDGSIPRFPIWDDVRTFSESNEACKSYFQKLKENKDKLVINAGFPCQDISQSGSGKGLDGERSGLWKDALRIICEVQPKYVYLENSAMLTSRGLDVILGNLASVGYNARWGVMGAGDLGAWHSRPRIWILAVHSGSFRMERQWMRWDVSKIRSWGKISPEYLREILEEPTTRKGEVIPLLCGSEYGMADWNGQIKAIGNGQAPFVAATAWRMLSQ